MVCGKLSGRDFDILVNSINRGYVYFQFRNQSTVQCFKATPKLIPELLCSVMSPYSISVTIENDRIVWVNKKPKESLFW